MELLKSAETVSLFCRLHMNQKRELPIRASEMGLLIFIVQNPEHSTPVMAARFFRVTKPMITAMVRVLEKKGYLYKAPSHEDGRSLTLHLTDKGRALVEETYDEYIGKMETLQSKMGANDFARLIALLEKANWIWGE